MDLPLESLIKKFYLSIADERVINEDVPIKETFTENVDDLILDTTMKTKDEVIKDNSILQSNKNKEIVLRLYNKGIFNLKDSVVRVSSLLNISKNTVYIHIRNLRNN